MLQTDWVTIGTAGFAIDGREIEEADLVTMAELYDPEEYTAVINSDHDLEWFGNYGHVVKLRTAKDKKQRTVLQARMAPNFRLIEMNRNGQRLFTSMEIWRDFAKTGKPYLTGLAVLDDPGSVGTTMLKFSRKKQNKEFETFMSEPVSLEMGLEPQEELINELNTNIPDGFFARLASFFKSDPAFNRATESQPPATDPSEDDMSKEALEKIQQQNEKLAESFATLADVMTKHFSTAEKEETPPEAGKNEGEEASTVTAEQFSKLEEQNGKLLQAVEGLTSTFGKLLEEKPGTPAGKNEGDADTTDFV